MSSAAAKSVPDYPEVRRTEFGLDRASGPRHFGFDVDYVPIEDRVGALGF